MYDSVIQLLTNLPPEEKTRVFARLVSSALRFVGMRTPKLEILVTVRLLGGAGTQQQCRSAKREARNMRYLTPDTSKALASWAAADDPDKIDVESFVTWFQNLACNMQACKPRGEVIASALNYIGELIAEECPNETNCSAD